MDFTELVQQIFTICVIPLLGILTKFLIDFIKIKSEEILGKVDNDLADKYIKMLTETITDCVIATNQTYVNSLKEQGKFDLEAQKVAFEMTCNSVLAILSDDAKEYLTNIFGDLAVYIKNKIEVSVNENRLVIKE